MIRKKRFLIRELKKIRIGLIKWLYIKKRIYKEKKGAPLGIKKAMYLKGGTVSHFI